MHGKILIVDDDVDIVELLQAALTSKGYQVKGTLSCSEAMEIFYSFNPELVVLDINVGHEDGREVCRQIKMDAAHRHIPVIMISANDEKLHSYEEYGANSILKKPFTVAELNALLVQQLRRVK